MEHDKYAVYIILLVAIVGVVALAGVLNNGMTTVTGMAINQVCTELGDSGIDLYTWGEISGYAQRGYGPYVLGDTCSGEQIVEYYCHEQGYVAYYKTECPEGYTCNNGVCTN